ncbi:hypothetical protein PtB15_17B215 [Puccinia triticina]|nr:hypothetical protein PtB15_17B215 [Puccinia triticina]
MYPQVAPVTVAAMLLPVDTIGRNSHQSRPSPPLPPMPAQVLLNQHIAAFSSVSHQQPAQANYRS